MVETAFHLLQTSRVLFLSVFLLSLLIALVVHSWPPRPLPRNIPNTFSGS